MGPELDYITGVIALVVMAAALIVKIVAVRLLAVMRRRIRVDAEAQQALLARAAEVQADRSVNESIVESLEQQRLDMEGRRSRLRKEVEALAEEAEKQERLREQRRRSIERG